MRAAAVALVMIIGAVVILWFGNTLNSWVLGGLIGGLAALLISIPISVALFLHLSHQHDEKVRAEVETSHNDSYDEYHQERHIEIYEAQAAILEPDDDWYEEDDYIAPEQRNLPVPSSSRTPAVRQSQSLTSTGSGMSSMRSRTSELSSTRRPSSRYANQRHYGPDFPRQGQKSTRSQHLTSALHVARIEALQQQADAEMYSSYSPTTSKRIPAVRSDEQMDMPLSAQSTRQFQSPFPRQNQYRPRRVVEGTSMPAIGNSNNQRSLPPEGGSSASRQQYYDHYNEPDTDQISHMEPQTGQLRNNLPQTGPMRQQPRTGQIGRNPHVEEQPRNPERASGTLKNPMVRRAPYMYEDDPMRQEFARHLEAPVVRRSSRKLRLEEIDE